jgi:hypothetical protein
VIGFAIDVIVQIMVPLINLDGVPYPVNLIVTLSGVFATGALAVVADQRCLLWLLAPLLSVRMTYMYRPPCVRVRSPPSPLLFTGCATAMLFGTILGLASIFPPTYITAVMSGNGVAGIIAGGLRCITKGALPNGRSPITCSSSSSLIFFGGGCC